MVGQFLPRKVTIFASVIDKWLVRRYFEATQISRYSDSGVLASIDGSCPNQVLLQWWQNGTL